VGQTQPLASRFSFEVNAPFRLEAKRLVSMELECRRLEWYFRSPSLQTYICSYISPIRICDLCWGRRIRRTRQATKIDNRSSV